MHRFYAFHSFTMFHRNTIAAAAFFLAAKVRKQKFRHNVTHRRRSFHVNSIITFVVLFFFVGGRAASQIGARYQNSQHLSRKDGCHEGDVCRSGTGARTQRKHSPANARI
jgi:hypothetical protein